MAAQDTLKNYNRENRLLKRRVHFMLAIIITLAGVLVFRLYNLQITDYTIYRDKALNNQTAIRPIPPRRGLIYDRRGTLLVENRPVYTLTYYPDPNHQEKAPLKRLAGIIHMSKNERETFEQSRKKHRPREPIPVKFGLSQEEMAKFYIHHHELPGFDIKARLMRHYLYPQTLAHVLGYVGRVSIDDLNRIDPQNYAATDYIGKTGVEKALEEELHGQTGYKEVEVNAQGHELKTLTQMPPASGQNIYLTIDYALQAKAQEALGDHQGAVVALDPRNGDILAMVSTPTYDPNRFVNGMDQHYMHYLSSSQSTPLYNRAVQGLYPPGSTIKPFYGIEALKSGFVTPELAIEDPGWFKLPGSDHIYHDWKHGGHNIVNLRKAIIVSCDTYFYELAVSMGIKHLVSALHAFGFGQSTGLQLMAERSGLVPSPEWKYRNKGTPWYKGDTVITGIGQGFLLATPLQLAQATATLANRGRYKSPHLLKRTYNPVNAKTMNYHTQSKQIAASPNSPIWNEVIKAMEGVIKSSRPPGTAVHFGRHAPYSVAGKTGTSQVFRPKAYKYKPFWEVPEKYWHDSLFIAFAPMNNPRIAVAVVVEHDPHARAQDVARQLMDYFMSRSQHE